MIRLFFSLLFTLYSLLWTKKAYADCTPNDSGFNIKDCFGFGDLTSLGDATSRLVVPAFSLAGTAVIIYFLMGAFKYLHSAGNKEETASARNMITHAIIGFIILIFIFFIIPYLLSTLFGITGFQLFKT